MPLRRSPAHGWPLVLLAVWCAAAHAMPWLQRLDTDGSGDVSPVELKTHVTAAGASHAAAHTPFPPDMFAALDADGSGGLDAWELPYPSGKLTPAPSEVHLSLTGKDTEVRVMWVTSVRYDSGTAPAANVTHANGTTTIATGTSATYTVPKRWWPGFDGWIHDVVMTGLTPGGFVRYSVGGVVHGSWVVSPTWNFTAARAPGVDVPTRLGMYGDMGVIPFGFVVTDHMLKYIAGHADTPFHAFMHVGDISYAGIDTNIPILNISNTDEWEVVWDQYGQQIAPFTRLHPSMVGVGNHDMFYNATAFRHRWHMPDTGNGNFWYSYDVGNVHIVSMSTEHPYAAGTPQWEWIQSDLAAAAANRATVPWIVFCSHRPFYCSDASEWDAHKPGAPLLAALEPLFLQYRVDVVISGHQHCYERVHPVKNGTVVQTPNAAGAYVDPGAPLYLVVGTAGALQEEKQVSPVPAWSANFGSNTFHTYGFGVLHTLNRTHLAWHFDAINAAGNEDVTLVVHSH